jgi:hypothetical protein
MDALTDSFQGAMDESVSPDANIGYRQWLYQSCTEYGYWQVAYHDPAVSVRSHLIDMDYHRNGCVRMFGLDQTGSEKAMNAKFYLPLLAASTSNILFTNGSEDPWSNLSITPKNGNDTNISTKTFVIEGGAHCSDLTAAKTPNVVAANDLFLQLAQGWLKQ